MRAWRYELVLFGHNRAVKISAKYHWNTHTLNFVDHILIFKIEISHLFRTDKPKIRGGTTVSYAWEEDEKKNDLFIVLNCTTTNRPKIHF